MAPVFCGTEARMFGNPKGHFPRSLEFKICRDGLWNMFFAWMSEKLEGVMQNCERRLAMLNGCGSSSLAAQSVSPAAARQEAIGSVKAW